MPISNPPAPNAGTNAVYLGNNNSGWSLISSKPGESQYQQSIGAGSTFLNTCRSIFYLPKGMTSGVTDIRIIFLNAINYNSVDYIPGPNILKIRASLWTTANSSTFLQASGDAPIANFTFGGSSTGICERGKQLAGEAHGVNLIQGQPYFLHCEQSCALVPALTAPVCTTSGSGSGFSSGTFYVSITQHFADGSESIASAYSLGATPSSGQNIVVTSPTNPGNGSDGYRVFISTAGQSSTNYPAYDCNVGVVPYGTNATIITPPNTNYLGWLECVFASGSSASIIGGGTIFGGTAVGGRANGEGINTNVDVIGGTKVSNASNGGNAFMPNAILVASHQGNWPSWAVQGDSIFDGTGDNGYGGSGGIGYMARAIVNQCSALQYSPTIIPTWGYVCVAVGGDSAKNFATNQGLSRSQLCNLAVNVADDYGTNDLTFGSSSIVASLQTIAARHTGVGKNWYYTGILPRGGVGSANSAYTNLTDQVLVVGGLSEGIRRAVNNWAADAVASNAITGDNLFQVFAGSVGPTYNVYEGGNGTATQFITAYPFLEGSETITNGGNACTYSASPSGQNQYSYLLPTTINGQSYASGITFGMAPTNGNLIVGAYTKISGMVALLGPLTHYLNAPLAIEINGSGNPQTNGGFIALSQTPVIGTIASPQSLSATSSTGFTDSTLTLTQDQYAGYCVAIVSDSVTPTAAGQVQCIATNTTAGVFTCGAWTVQPSTSAKYVILLSNMQTSTHPSSQGHMVIGAYIRSQNPTLFPY